MEYIFYIYTYVRTYVSIIQFFLLFHGVTFIPIPVGHVRGEKSVSDCECTLVYVIYVHMYVCMYSTHVRTYFTHTYVRMYVRMCNFIGFGLIMYISFHVRTYMKQGMKYVVTTAQTWTVSGLSFQNVFKLKRYTAIPIKVLDSMGRWNFV